MKQHWQEEELAEFWALLPEEMELLSGFTEVNRLGFAILLKFAQIEGSFPRRHQEVPDVTVDYLAKVLAVQASLFSSYRLSTRNAKFHRTQIRSFLGIRPCTNEDAKLGSVAKNKQVDALLNF